MTTYMRHLPSGRYRFRHVARMEWIKLRSLRSTWCTLALAVAASAGVAVTAGPGHSSGTSATSLFVNSALIGVLIGVLLSGVLGVLLILATLAAAPRRPLVLAAKAAVYGAVALIAGEAAAFLSFFAGRMAAGRGITAPTLGSDGVFQAVVLTGASLSLIGLLGLGLGAIIRHSGAAIGVMVGGVYVAATFIGNLARGVSVYTPIIIVGNSLSTTKPENCGNGAFGCPHFLSAWAGLGLLCLYAAVALAVGGWMLARRDA
jgi:ABC-2 type transport system permease protein